MKRLLVCIATFVLTVTVPRELPAQSPLEPGWTASTFFNSTHNLAVGIVFDCSTDGFYVGGLAGPSGGLDGPIFFCLVSGICG